MKKEFKRFSKEAIIMQIILMVSFLLLYNIVFGKINYYVSAIIIIYFASDLLFSFFADMQRNIRILKVSIFTFNAIIFVFIYFLVNEYFEQMYLLIFLVVAVYLLYTVPRVRQVNTPSFVIDGYIDEKLAKQFQKKLFKRIGISLIIATIFTLIVIGLSDFIKDWIY